MSFQDIRSENIANDLIYLFAIFILQCFSHLKFVQFLFYKMTELTETMRIIQYPRVVSIQSFQRPNFELVADLLCFMVLRYDTDIPIHDSIDNEQNRVRFITTIVKAMYLRANIKLNAKKLYSADGHAVKELLILASLLSNTAKLAREEESSSKINNDYNNESKISDVPGFSRDDNLSKHIDLSDVKRLRKLASELTEKGARVFDLLKAEQERNRSQKEETLKFLDAASTGFDDCPEIKHVESTLKQILEKKQCDVADMEQECKVMESDKSDIIEDIKRKTLDFERNKKRLESIQNARPAFMDEYEQLEIELQKHYELYMERYRNVHYLKKEMEKFQKEEEEKLDEIQRVKRKLQSQIKEEELKILRDDYSVKDGGNDTNREDPVPLLDTTDDSLVIVEGDYSNDNENDVFIEDDEPISIMQEADSIGISTRTSDSKNASQSIMSSKASTSFSGLSAMSPTGNDDDDNYITSFNQSPDSADIF